MISRTILIMLLLFVFCGFGSCPRRQQGPDVKVYVSKPARGGALRNEEVKPYSETENYRMMNKSDFDALLNYCLAPREESKKKRSKLIYNINTIIDPP